MEAYLNKYLNQIRDLMLTRPCYYIVKDKLCQSNIKRVTIEFDEHFGIKVTAYLANGTNVIMHNDGAPYFVGQVPWGFLSRTECEEYWGM